MGCEGGGCEGGGLLPSLISRMLSVDVKHHVSFPTLVSQLSETFIFASHYDALWQKVHVQLLGGDELQRTVPVIVATGPQCGGFRVTAEHKKRNL